jgi:NADH:ubiquinone oxidoreductase subunit 6 (subunit J)
MKNAILAGFFGLLTVGAGVGIAKATNAGVFLACWLLFVGFGMAAFYHAEEARR